jgi:hypothetical protein
LPPSFVLIKQHTEELTLFLKELAMFLEYGEMLFL